MTILRPLNTDIDAELRELEVVTEDGVTIGLTRFRRGQGERSVVLLHGLAMSADMFVMPEHDNIVESLLDAGWSDVWCVDWRGSCRLPYNVQNRGDRIDDVALYDLPAAFAEIRRLNGGRPIAVICQCVGALAMAMALAAKVVGPISALVANSVFLTPDLREQTRLKIMTAPAMFERIFPDGYLPMNPADVGLLSPRALVFAMAAAGSTCKDPTCQMISFAWATGDSPMFEHVNLHPSTHARLLDLFGPAPLSYYAHIRKMAYERAVVRYDLADARYDALPRSALDVLDDWSTPLLLTTGVHNGVWGGAMQLCAEYLFDRHPHIDVTLTELPGYGHVDVFIGRAAALDVFPRMINWLDSKVPASHGA